MEMLEEQLEQLLLHKSYGQLSEAERSYVAVFLSEEEYKQYGLLLTQSKTVLKQPEKNLKPLSANLHHLKKAFQTTHQRSFNLGLSVSSFPFRLPVLQTSLAGAAVLLLVFFFGWYSKDKPSQLALPASENIKKESITFRPAATETDLPVAKPNKIQVANRRAVKSKIAEKPVIQKAVVTTEINADTSNLKEIEEYLLQVNLSFASDSANAVYYYISDMELPATRVKESNL